MAFIESMKCCRAEVNVFDDNIGSIEECLKYYDSITPLIYQALLRQNEKKQKTE